MMVHDERAALPPVAPGLAALVLGAVGLLLFFLPILSLPLAACGIVIGAAALVLALFGKTSLRWAVIGLTIACLALLVSLAIALAPAGYARDYRVPQMWQVVPDQPYVPPPARP